MHGQHMITGGKIYLFGLELRRFERITKRSLEQPLSIDPGLVPRSPHHANAHATIFLDAKLTAEECFTTRLGGLIDPEGVFHALDSSRWRR